jgi:hypothetical protein
MREPDYKIVGPMKERGGPAGVILKNGYISNGEIFIELTFSVTKVFFLQQQDWQ